MNAATLVGLCAILVWSSLSLLTVLSGTMPAFELAASTFAIGGGAGLLAAALRGRLGALRQPWPVWSVGVGGLFLYHALYFAALRIAPPAEAGLFNYLWPLLIVLFSALLPGEKLAMRHICGAVVAFAGLLVLVAGPQSSTNAGLAIEPRYFAGYGLAFAAAIVWAAYSVLSRRFKRVPTDAVAGFCLATAALAALCHSLFEPTVWPDRASQWAAIVALGLGPVGLAFYVWDHGVKHGDIRLLGIASHGAPVLSTLALVAAGFSAPSASLAVACLLIVAGALVATRRRARGRRERGLRSRLRIRLADFGVRTPLSSSGPGGRDTCRSRDRRDGDA
jgi:drug/metabolite transporter (DMT)-like permease